MPHLAAEPLSEAWAVDFCSGDERSEVETMLASFRGNNARSIFGHIFGQFILRSGPLVVDSLARCCPKLITVRLKTPV